MAVTADNPGPYAPAPAVIDLITRHRDRGLPAPINGEILQRAGISESLTPRTLQSLRVLDLIDDEGRPTPVFEGLRMAPEAEYHKRMEDWLKGTYADVFAFVDPAKHSLTQVRDAFRGYQPTGQQDRMVNLFMGLCVAAGIVGEKEKPPLKLRVKAKPKSTLMPKLNAYIASARGDTSRKNGMATTSFPTGLPPALAGMLQSLPVSGTGWTKEQRDRFMTTFETVIDFVIPIKSKAEITAEEEQTD